MKEFICPVCSEPLSRKGKSLFCPKGHCFDLAKSGYVNLCLSSSAGKQHGDDRGMVTARHDFLDQGYYQPLLDALCEEVNACLPRKGNVLDAGCGECWYTDGLSRYLKKMGREISIYGIDL